MLLSRAYHRAVCRRDENEIDMVDTPELESYLDEEDDEKTAQNQP